MPPFTEEENVRRIMINPFYAITVAPRLTQEHEPAVDEAEWVLANAALIEEMGAERWLRQLLDVMEGDIVTAEEIGFAAPHAMRGGSRPVREKKGRRKKRRRR